MVAPDTAGLETDLLRFLTFRGQDYTERKDLIRRYLSIGEKPHAAAGDIFESPHGPTGDGIVDIYIVAGKGYPEMSEESLSFGGSIFFNGIHEILGRSSLVAEDVVFKNRIDGQLVVWIYPGKLKAGIIKIGVFIQTAPDRTGFEFKVFAIIDCTW